jgi:hypothetical protein
MPYMTDASASLHPKPTPEFPASICTAVWARYRARIARMP